MPLADGAIRAKRKLTNRLIAAHDAARLRPHLADDIVVIVGDGELIQGADAVVAAFAAQFADPAFVAYERTTETVAFGQGISPETSIYRTPKLGRICG